MPELFPEDSDMIEVSIKPSTLPAMSIEVLKALQEPIIAKLDTCSIANLADIVFAYS
jgi:hypothetical protein